MFDIRVINRSTAKPFIEQYHYTKSVGKVSLAFGLFDTDNQVEHGIDFVDKLVGVITYGQVSSRDLAQSLFEQGTQKNTWEFLRMAVLDDVVFPRTAFIAKTIKHIKRNFPQIKCLVSFADQTEGHFGYVYQAANWIYCGTTGKKYHYIVDGKRVNKRMAYDKAVQLGITEREFVTQNKWGKIEELPKFRYVYLLDRHIQLKLERLKYPKFIERGE